MRPCFKLSACRYWRYKGDSQIRLIDVYGGHSSLARPTLALEMSTWLMLIQQRLLEKGQQPTVINWTCDLEKCKEEQCTKTEHHLWRHCCKTHQGKITGYLLHWAIYQVERVVSWLISQKRVFSLPRYRISQCILMPPCDIRFLMTTHKGS